MKHMNNSRRWFLPPGHAGRSIWTQRKTATVTCACCPVWQIEAIVVTSHCAADVPSVIAECSSIVHKRIIRNGEINGGSAGICVDNATGEQCGSIVNIDHLPFLELRAGATPP